MFSTVVSSHWLPSGIDVSDAHDVVVVAVVPSLAEDRSVSLVRLKSGQAILSISPVRAEEFAIQHGSHIDDATLSLALESAGVQLNAPDNVYYLSLEAQASLRAEKSSRETRQLTEADSAAFEAFTARAPDDDLDDAYVELDHWLVFGTFVGSTLVSAASMYPWDGTTLADLGVITLPEFRGRGLGRRTVRALSASALERGYEPQYRCQLDNSASITLAEASDFTLFGEWEVIITNE